MMGAFFFITIAYIYLAHMTMKVRFNVGEFPLSLFFLLYSGRPWGLGSRIEIEIYSLLIIYLEGSGK